MKGRGGVWWERASNREREKGPKRVDWRLAQRRKKKKGDFQNADRSDINGVIVSAG